MKYDLKEGEVVLARSISTTGPAATINNGYPLGNTFQVRVLPEMADIEETDLLPTFPNFFKDEQTAYQPHDKVWLFCTEDFQAGFILGRSPSAAGFDLIPLLQVINTAEGNAGLQKSGYNEITIEGASGSAIRFVNEINGQAGVVYNNKTVYLYGPKGEIWINNPGMKAYVNPDGDMLLEAKSRTESFTADSTTTVQGQSSETVGSKKLKTSGMLTLSAGGSRQDVTSSNKNESVLGDSQTVVGGSYTLKVGPEGLTLLSLGSINLTAPIITLSGTVEGPPGIAGPPMGIGGYCALPACLFTGAPHTTTTIPGA